MEQSAETRLPATSLHAEQVVAAAEQAMRAEAHGFATGLAGARELKWLTLALLALFIPVFAGPYLLASHQATLVCYYGAIVGFVVAGWGVVRSALNGRRGGSLFRFIALLYGIFFLLLSLAYGTLMLSPTLDKRWGMRVPGDSWGNSPMRIK